jgi:hypothetical protein
LGKPQKPMVTTQSVGAKRNTDGGSG